LNILIFNPSYLGDSVLTTPLIKAVKMQRPDSRITFCVRPENAGLFEGVDFIDEVISYDKRGEFKGLGGIFRFAKILREKNFDMVISPHMSFRSTMTLYLAGIPERAGFVESALSAFYTISVAKDLNYHEVERYLLIYERIFNHFPKEKIKPEVYLDKEKAAEYKAELGENLVGINPGSVWDTKKWPAEYFAQTADWLKDHGYTPVIVGSEADRADVDKLLANAKYDHISYCGKTTLRELPALISNFSYFVTNDSGPMHIAVAAGVPCVAIFGPTVKKQGFIPYDEVSKVAEISGLSCRPCGKHGGDRCRKKHFKCMKEILPENVISLFEIVSAPDEKRTPKYITEKVD